MHVHVAILLFMLANLHTLLFLPRLGRSSLPQAKDNHDRVAAQSHRQKCKSCTSYSISLIPRPPLTDFSHAVRGRDVCFPVTARKRNGKERPGMRLLLYSLVLVLVH